MITIIVHYDSDPDIYFFKDDTTIKEIIDTMLKGLYPNDDFPIYDFIRDILNGTITTNPFMNYNMLVDPVKLYKDYELSEDLCNFIFDYNFSIHRGKMKISPSSADTVTLPEILKQFK